MTRKTKSEKTFESWCKENGGEFEIGYSDESKCTHPNGDVLKYEDPAFEGNSGKMLVPWSGQSDKSDTIFFETSHFSDVDNSFRGPDVSEGSLAFVNRRDYKFASIEFGDEGFKLDAEGEY